MMCEWQNIKADDEHEKNVRECPACAGTFCGPCRDAVYDEDHCPLCNTYVGPDSSCRLTGGCGK